MAVKQRAEASRKKKAVIMRTSLLHVFTSTLQIMDDGKCPHVTPRSAAAKERMNQLVVVCNLLLLAMMKIIQVFPNRSKKVKKPTGSPVNIHLLLAVRLNLELIMKICRRVWSVDGFKGIKLTGFSDCNTRVSSFNTRLSAIFWRANWSLTCALLTSVSVVSKLYLLGFRILGFLSLLLFK